jgi:hypothetical protein
MNQHNRYQNGDVYEGEWDVAAAAAKDAAAESEKALSLALASKVPKGEGGAADGKEGGNADGDDSPHSLGRRLDGRAAIPPRSLAHINLVDGDDDEAAAAVCEEASHGGSVRHGFGRHVYGGESGGAGEVYV